MPWPTPASRLPLSDANVPSLSGEELPAVTGPVAENAGLRPASFSAVVSAYLDDLRFGSRYLPAELTAGIAGATIAFT